LRGKRRKNATHLERLKEYDMKLDKKPELVTIEGQCKSCKNYTPAAFRLNEYLQEVLKAYPSEVVVIKQCPGCKNNDSLEFSLVL
jgi:antitoxin component HigA of HigAB toxin-antitoxin module